MRKGLGPLRGALGGPDARFWVGGVAISVDVVLKESEMFVERSLCWEVH